MGRPPKKSKTVSPKKSKSPAKKRAKKEKDPNRPKRAKTGYMIWLAENRPRLSKSGMSVTEVVKAAGAEWRKMTIADKSKLEKVANEDKKRYEKEMAVYKSKKGKK